jgi:methionyl-tRNA formyltransferase
LIGIQSKLRFGIMCDGPHLAEWEHRCVAKVLEIEGVEATLIIVRDELSQIIAGKRANVRGRASKLLWRVYRRYALERSSSAAKLRAFPDYLNRIPILKVGIQKIGKYRQELYHQDINKLREENLDFILQFRSGILSGDVLEVARFGIWSFHHGDPHHYRGRPPGFWERLESRPVTGAILQRLTERLDAGVRLYTGQFKTDMASYVRSLDGLYFGVADWPARVCKDILNGCAAYLNDPPIATSAPITREPSNLQMLRFLAKQAKEWLALHWKSLFRHQQWCVGLVDAPLPSIVRTPAVN